MVQKHEFEHSDRKNPAGNSPENFENRNAKVARNSPETASNGVKVVGNGTASRFRSRRCVGASEMVAGRGRKAKGRRRFFFFSEIGYGGVSLSLSSMVLKKKKKKKKRKEKKKKKWGSGRRRHARVVHV